MFQNQPFIDPLQNRCSWMIDKIHWKKLLLESLFSKVAVLGTCNFIKEGSPTHVFSCEICKLFKSNYFEEHLWTSGSKLYFKRNSNTGAFLWILWIIQEHLFCRRSMNSCFRNTSAGSFFNKVASLAAWRHLTVLERL